jgi:hypothetical protein
MLYFFLKKSVQDIAKETTVLIMNNPSGSGVIIKRVDNKYSVLTTRHTVYRDETYTIRTYDGQVHRVDNSTIIKDSKIDLAILQFTSNNSKKYSYAKISKKLTQGMNVYISGWKECTTPSYEFNQGKILEVSNNNPTYKNLGYLTKYSNPTIGGMSGSPVFDNQGNVVAIHAASEHDNSFDTEKCPTLDASFGNNWGIPMEKFVASDDLKSKLPNIKAENSTAINPQQDISPNILPSPNPQKTPKNCLFCPPQNYQTP